MCAFLSCSLHLGMCFILLITIICVFSVPNISFELYSPSFFEKFTESHAVMTQVCCTLVIMMVKMMVRILL